MEFIRYFFEQSAGQRRLRELKPNQCGNLILGERHALCVPIYAQTEKIAYLLLSCTQWHIPDMDVIAFEHASSLIAIELLKERALVDKEQKGPRKAARRRVHEALRGRADALPPRFLARHRPQEALRRLYDRPG